jgi:hypothetical protein
VGGLLVDMGACVNRELMRVPAEFLFFSNMEGLEAPVEMYRPGCGNDSCVCDVFELFWCFNVLTGS